MHLAVYAEGAERSLRDMKSLKQKFDGLANTKKRTGDPNCPSLVRRATHIARGVLNRVNAVSVGALSESGSDAGVSGGGSSDTDGIKRERNESKLLGCRNKRRVASAAGVIAGQDEEDSKLVKCVSEMSNAVTALVNGMSDEKNSDNLEDLVRLQIKEKMGRLRRFWHVHQNVWRSCVNS